MGKSVISAADSLDTVRKVAEALSNLDIELVSVPLGALGGAVSDHSECDLVIVEVKGKPSELLQEIQPMLMSAGVKAILLIVGESQLAGLRLPMNMSSDFIMSSYSPEELGTRAGLLLWPGNETSATDVVAIDGLSINLATYQVQIDGNPVDLTYLEYALLAFLATHPGKTYARDTLLKRVWGFDYYGGSRTIDVHVRRIRAKLGPELAQHLQTIRGVGYLWSA